jgi:hypothetical protein
METRGSLFSLQKTTTGPILNRINPVHTFIPCYFKIHFNLNPPSVPYVSRVSFLSCTQTKIVYEFPIPRMLWPAHLILFDLITLTVLGKECKSWSCSLYNFIQPPIISSLLGQNVIRSTLFSNILDLLNNILLGHYPSSSFNYKHDVSGTRICFCPHVAPALLGPVDWTSS